MKQVLLILAGLILMAASFGAKAEVLEASPQSYTLRHEALSDLPPEELWQRLIRPQDWWHPNHTYSGFAENLALQPEAGGTWREDWEGGSVRHGVVLSVLENRQLRLDAPFGPLQGMPVTVIWTITLEAADGGTRVVFDEVASGTPSTALDKIASAVDGVKLEAITRLTTTP